MTYETNRRNDNAYGVGASMPGYLPRYQSSYYMSRRPVAPRVVRYSLDWQLRGFWKLTGLSVEFIASDSPEGRWLAGHLVVRGED